MKKLVSIFLLLISLNSFPSGGVYAAAIHLDKDIQTIPAYITDIYLCGHWKHGKAEGAYRIVYVEFYYGNSLLYIQWVKDFTSNDITRHVMQTLSIDEFNADDHIELTFDKPRCIETGDGIKFDIEAISGHDDKTHRFTLQIEQGFGKYHIKEHKRE